MSTTSGISRRVFLEQTAGIGAAALAADDALSADAPKPKGGPSKERVRVGLIGVGLQGTWHLGILLKQPDVVVTAICDVWKERLDKALASCNGSARGYHDYRELLAQKDVDAVLIATPPHWHALQAIDACEAGKDFYLEKPMTLTVAESLAVMRAVRKTGRITQIGTQIHAGANYRKVVAKIRSGKLGKISVVRNFMVMNQGPNGIGNLPDCDPPKGLDWEMWCGPAPIRKFNPLIVKDAAHHCSFMDYSGGWTPGMAPHVVDLPYWAMNLGHPVSVSSSGGRYAIHDAGDCPDTHEVLWQYPGLTMTWMMSLINKFGFFFHGDGKHQRSLGVYFHGLNGTMIANYGTHKVFPDGDGVDFGDVSEYEVPTSPGHHREWLDCLRSRRQPSCHVGYHYKISVAIALANLSLQLGRSLRFDPQRETVVGDVEAQRMQTPVYRDPWKLPERYL